MKLANPETLLQPTATAEPAPARELQQRCMMLSAMAQLSKDAMLVIERDSRCAIEANAAACELLQAPRAALLGADADGIGRLWLWLPLQPARLDEAIAQAPRVLRVDDHVRHGERIAPVELRMQAIQVQGRWLVVVALTDLSQTRQTDARLRWFRLAMDQTQDMFSLIDRDSVSFIDVSAELQRRTGLDRERLLRADPATLLADVTREDLERFFDEAIAAAPQPCTRTTGFRLPGGEVLPVDHWATAVQLDGRWVIATSTRDMSERLKAQRQMRQRLEDLARSNRELEQFAYVASHDLSEPLRMVASYTQLMERRLGEEMVGDIRDFMGYIIGGARRMQRMIDDLLAFSRAGRARLSPRPVNLGEVMQSVTAALAGKIGASSATVTHHDLPTVLADRTTMTELLHQLLDNALKFSDKAPPRVQVSARRTSLPTDPPGWIIEVADRGQGLEARYFERIFLIFQCLHPRDTYEGTGVGLAICKRIVEHQGGRIWVESQPGEGARFMFTVPDEPYVPLPLPDTVPMV